MRSEIRNILRETAMSEGKFGQRPGIKEGYAYLSEEFGQNLAMKKFDMTIEQLEKIVGRYTRGKRMGQLRGVLRWFKIESGGFQPTGYRSETTDRVPGFLVREKGATFGYRIEDYNGKVLYGSDYQDSRGNVDWISYYQEWKGIEHTRKFSENAWTKESIKDLAMHILLPYSLVVYTVVKYAWNNRDKTNIAPFIGSARAEQIDEYVRKNGLHVDITIFRDLPSDIISVYNKVDDFDKRLKIEYDMMTDELMEVYGKKYSNLNRKNIRESFVEYAPWVIKETHSLKSLIKFLLVNAMDISIKDTEKMYKEFDLNPNDYKNIELDFRSIKREYNEIIQFKG